MAKMHFLAYISQEVRTFEMKPAHMAAFVHIIQLCCDLAVANFRLPLNRNPQYEVVLGSFGARCLFVVRFTGFFSDFTQIDVGEFQ